MIVGDKAINFKSGRVKFIDDLSPKSNYSVEVECPKCKKKRFMFYAKTNVKSFTGYCNHCAGILKQKDLKAGDVFGRLTVIGKHSINKSVVMCECGKEDIVINWLITSGRKKSCGCLKKETFIKHGIRKHFEGEDHPNWKGGITGERYRFMAKAEYVQWRKFVYERDNYTCQKCGATNKRLQAHHIYSYNKYEDMRTDINNGITLCVDCHECFHKTYSYSYHKPDDTKNFIVEDNYAVL